MASAEGQRLLRRLLRAAYRWPEAPVHHTVRDVVREPAARRRPLGARGRPPSAGGRIRGVLPRVGVSPDACAARLTADQWHRLAMLLAGG